MFEEGDKVRVNYNLKEIDSLLRVQGYDTPSVVYEMECLEGRIFTIQDQTDNGFYHLREAGWTWHEAYLELVYDDDKIEVSSEEELLDLLS